MFQLIFYVPPSHLEKVKNAVFKAGAGRYKNYDQCCWQTQGEGQFRPLTNSEPFLGKLNKLEKTEEYKVEMVVEDKYIKAVVVAFIDAHPYEEPAFSVLKVESFSYSSCCNLS